METEEKILSARLENGLVNVETNQGGNLVIALEVLQNELGLLERIEEDRDLTVDPLGKGVYLDGSPLTLSALKNYSEASSSG